MHNSVRYSRHHAILALLLFVLLILSGCTIKLISSYDEATDKAVTALQRKIETFLVALESQEGLPECAYDNHKRFYEEVKVDISAIQVRAQAIPMNEITIKQVTLLSDSINQLEQLHQLKKKFSNEQGKLICISKEEIMPLRTAFNASFAAILKLELAKKRGDKK